MAVTFNFQNNGYNGPTIYYDYPMATSVSTTSPATIPYTIQIYNPLSIPLYAQVSGSVTLASGSTAICSLSTVNLGALSSNTNTSSTAATFMLTNLTVSSYPTTTGMNEVETVNITVSLYLDSDYSNLYESGNSSFRLDFINSNNTSYTIVVDYDGNTTPSLGFSGISSLTYVTSPVLVSNGYSIEVNSTTIPSGAWADFTNGGGIEGTGSGVFSLGEYFVYPTSTTTSIPGEQPFSLQSPVGEVDISYPYFYVTTANTWQIMYISGANFNGNGWSFNVGNIYPSFTSVTGITYYLGYMRFLASTTNFI